MSEICTSDFVWENSGLPTLRGQAEISDIMAKGGFSSEIPTLKEMTYFTVDLIHIASHGDVVFTERVDHHWAKDGRDLMAPHIAGVIEIRDGKIARLADFYDTICYNQEPTAPDPALALT